MHGRCLTYTYDTEHHSRHWWFWFKDSITIFLLRYLHFYFFHKWLFKIALYFFFKEVHPLHLFKYIVFQHDTHIWQGRPFQDAHKQPQHCTCLKAWPQLNLFSRLAFQHFQNCRVHWLHTRRANKVPNEPIIYAFGMIGMKARQISHTVTENKFFHAYDTFCIFLAIIFSSW